MSLYRPSKEQLKEKLSLPYVCAELGIMLDVNDTALCPFHADTNPSFHLFEGDDGYQRYSCMPCGIRGGDVFDLIMRKLGYDFSDAFEYAEALYDRLPPGYEPPRLQAPVANPEDFAAEVREAQLIAGEKEYHGMLAVATGLISADRPTEAATWDTYLRLTWGWGFHPNVGVYMPHWDEAGQLTGCKIRKSSGDRISARGSRYENLYGCWLGTRYKDTIICEGETDAAWAGYQAAVERLELNVVALPRGASAEVDARFVNYLSRARGIIYLALDPDEAGVEATRAWIENLDVAGFGDRVRFCALPLGKDLRDARPGLRHLLSEGKRPLPPPLNLNVSPAGFVRTDRAGNMYLATAWTVDPTAVLTGGTDPGFDVKLQSRGPVREEVLRLSDLESIRTLNRWANKHGLVYNGSDSDRHAITEFVLARAAVVPEIFQTAQVGSHAAPLTYPDAGTSIVYPTGYKGKIPWRYAPSNQTADVTAQVLLPAPPGEITWRWLDAFLALNGAATMHPFLAWLAASARRNEISRFPLLFISGSSGVGKSTLAELGSRLFGSAIRIDLGGVTPFVLLRTLSASSTLPVFVDEYTRMSRRETREAFQGIIPSLYTSDYAERGQADLSIQRYRMSAPTIVAGEDTFALDRELERVVTVRPSRAGQNHKALDFIRGAPLERFAERYHYWIAAQSEHLPPFVLDADTRPEYNRAVLQTGWETLRAFLLHEALAGERPPSLPEFPDLSGLVQDERSEGENVYLNAVQEGSSMRDGNGCPYVWAAPEGGTYIRAQQLVGALSRSQIDIQLPGGSRAMISYFEERYGKRLKERVTPPMGVARVWADWIPGLNVDDDDEPEGREP